MNKQALISHTRTVITKTDGYYYLLPAEDFINLMRLEDVVEQTIVVPHVSANVSNLMKWKEKLVVMTANRLRLHSDLKIVLMKEPDRCGELDNFLFDSFLFNNISTDNVTRLRTLLGEENNGLFKTFTELNTMRSTNVLPYYVRLSYPHQDNDNTGIWVLRKFY